MSAARRGACSSPSSGFRHVLPQGCAELRRAPAVRCRAGPSVGTVRWYRLRGPDHLRYVHVARQINAPLQADGRVHSPVSGTACVKLNDYYSQCQPGAAPAPPPSSTVSAPSAPTPTTPTGSAPPGLSTIPASTLHQISNFGTNPNGVTMYVYKPKNVQPKPALIVASHCT